jgi:hypothetical protein
MYYVDRLNNGQHPKGRKRLSIGYDFKCSKQPLDSLHCGYYTYEHLRITGQYIVNHEKVSYHCVIYLLNLSGNIFTLCVLINVLLCFCSLLINNQILLFYQHRNYQKECAYLFDKNMQKNGTDHVISDMCMFLRREMFNA